MPVLYSQLLEAVSQPHRHLAPTAEEFAASQKKILQKVLPGKTLSVSLTATACEQQCAHCNGHYLKGMATLSDLNAEKLSAYDAVLLSGGSNTAGAVNFQPHFSAILGLPEHLKINIHPGFQPAANLTPLLPRRPAVSFDLPGNNEVISEVFRLPYSVQQFRDLYLDYCQQFRTTPHVTIGLHGGKPCGEKDTIDFLSAHQPEELVFIIFRPTLGTELANAAPPELKEAVGIIEYARKKLSCPVMLGCMRPAGIYRRDLDILAWLHGVKKIVHPDHQLIKILQNNSVTIEEYKNCCALNM